MKCSFNDVSKSRGTWWTIDTEKSMPDSDPISLTKNNTDPVLLQVHVDIKGITERFFCLFLWQVVVVVVDQTPGFWNDENIVDTHVGIKINKS